MFQQQTLADSSNSDPDDHLWAYIRASGALLRARVHQLLEHERELLQLMGRRISEKLSMAHAVPSEETLQHRRCEILLVDDQPRIRTAVRTLLAGYQDLEVIAEACNGQQAVVLADACQPDVVVMDINMPKVNGITATGLIKRHRPETIVIGLSFYDHPNFKKAFVDAGGSALIPKHEAAEHLYPAIIEYWKQVSQEKKCSG